MGMPPGALVEKKVETHWLSGQEKNSCKEDHADNVLRHEKNNDHWFP